MAGLRMADLGVAGQDATELGKAEPDKTSLVVAWLDMGGQGIYGPHINGLDMIEIGSAELDVTRKGLWDMQ